MKKIANTLPERQRGAPIFRRASSGQVRWYFFWPRYFHANFIPPLEAGFHSSQTSSVVIIIWSWTRSCETISASRFRIIKKRFKNIQYNSRVGEYRKILRMVIKETTKRLSYTVNYLHVSLLFISVWNFSQDAKNLVTFTEKVSHIVEHCVDLFTDCPLAP